MRKGDPESNLPIEVRAEIAVRRLKFSTDEKRKALIRKHLMKRSPLTDYIFAKFVGDVPIRDEETTKDKETKLKDEDIAKLKTSELKLVGIKYQLNHCSDASKEDIAVKAIKEFIDAKYTKGALEIFKMLDKEVRKRILKRPDLFGNIVKK